MSGKIQKIRSIQLIDQTSCGDSINGAPGTPQGANPGGGGGIPTSPLQFNKKTDPPLWLEETSLEIAADFVLRHHYSKVMPKQTKLILGAFKGKNGPLIGVITFGWGVRPKDTIRQLFPTVDVSEYYEIGKMCVHDSEPKNTESRLLSLAIRWLKKNKPELKVLFTWADALWGKPGYVYQAANFRYGGYIWTDVYMDKEGRRFHPRQIPAKLRAEGLLNDVIRLRWRADNEIGSCRPSKKQKIYKNTNTGAPVIGYFNGLKDRGWKHCFGMQYRYVYFLQDKWTKELLQDASNARQILYDVERHGIEKKTGKKYNKGAIEQKTVFKQAIVWRRPKIKNENIYPKFSDIRWRIDKGDGIGESTSDQPKFGEAFDPNRK